MREMAVAAQAKSLSGLTRDSGNHRRRCKVNAFAGEGRNILLGGM